MKLSKASGLLITTIVATLFLFFFYPKVFLHPNNLLLSDTGDGIKSAAVFAGHIVNDSSYIHYSNMNYPYGQHHAFTDGMTALAIPLKFLSSVHPFFSTHCIAIFNLAAMLSFILCAVFIFLVLTEFRVNVLTASAGALCIMLLSPQVHRLGGHSSLAYAFVFPLAWLLFIYFFSRKRKTFFSCLLCLLSAITFFIHPYLMMMVIMFSGLCWIIIFISNRKHAFHRTNIIHFALQVIVPLLFTQLFIHLTDSHPARSKFPWGFWFFYAEVFTVFFPTHGPFKFLTNLFFSSRIQEWEAWSYIGIFSFIFCGLTFVRILLQIRRKRIKSLFPFTPYLLKVSFVSSIIVLAFSMCIPFRWAFDFIVNDWLTFLRQFRCLGRFAWVFYYVITVFAFYYLHLFYRLLRMRRQKIIAFSLTVFIPAVYIAEGLPYHSETSKRIQSSINWFDRNQLPGEYIEAIEEINRIKNDYQCIVPLPFYHVGTENFHKGFTDNMIRSSMVLSHHSDFPLLSSSAARSPIPEGKKIMQFFSPSFYEKELKEDLPNKKDFLILYDREPITAVETYWLGKAIKVFENDLFVFARLQYHDVFYSDAEEILNEFYRRKDSLFYKNGYWISSVTDTAIYKSYDDLKSENSYRGGGSFEAQRTEYNFILEKSNLNLKPEKEYIASFWFYNKGELRNQTGFNREVSDAKGENAGWKETTTPGHSMIIDGDWSLTELHFKTAPLPEQMSFFTKSFEKENMKIWIDEFLLRPADTDVYQVIIKDHKKYLIKNNILIPVPIDTTSRVRLN